MKTNKTFSEMSVFLVFVWYDLNTKEGVSAAAHGCFQVHSPEINPIVEDSTFFIWHIQSYTSTTCSEMCADTLLRCAKHG